MPRPNKWDAAGSAAAVSAAAETENTRNHQAPGGAPGNYYYPKPKYLIIGYLDPLCVGIQHLEGLVFFLGGGGLGLRVSSLMIGDPPSATSNENGHSAGYEQLAVGIGKVINHNFRTCGTLVLGFLRMYA